MEGFNSDNNSKEVKDAGTEKISVSQKELGSLSSRTWEARKPFILEKDYFQLQYDFVKEIHNKTGESLFDLISARAPELREAIYNFDSKYKINGMKDGVTEENLLDFAYDEYLKTTAEQEPVTYHEDGYTGFGCFYYNQEDEDKHKDTIRIHFFNAEFDETSPLDEKKIEIRKSEIRDLLQDIKTKHPEAKEISGNSWLYQSETYKKFFPESYLKNLEANNFRHEWGRGTTIWGQFLDNQCHLKKDLAEELLSRVRELEPTNGKLTLAEVFQNGSKIVSPLVTHGPIQDFYDMYGVK